MEAAQGSPLPQGALQPNWAHPKSPSPRGTRARSVNRRPHRKRAVRADGSPVPAPFFQLPLLLGAASLTSARGLPRERSRRPRRGPSTACASRAPS